MSSFLFLFLVGSVYDAFFQIKPEILYRFCPELGSSDFTVDLCGTKVPQIVTTEYIFTTQKSRNFIHSYANRMKPDILNIINKIDGKA